MVKLIERNIDELDGYNEYNAQKDVALKTQIMEKFSKKQLDDFISHFEKEEIPIIRMGLGIDDGKIKDIYEVAKELNIEDKRAYAVEAMFRRKMYFTMRFNEQLHKGK